MFADDLADACIFLMDNYDEKGLINIGTGEEVTIKELANLVKDVVGFEGDIQFDTTKPDGTPRKLMDSSRLHNMGWKHTTSLKEGLKKTFDWYQQQVKV